MERESYEVTVATPMGELDGRVDLVVDGGALSGTFYLMGKDADFEGGTVDEAGNLAFAGELKVPFVGTLDYTVDGTLVNGRIDATVHTKLGDFAVRSK